jgi:nucleoid-associated protein YgaU
LAQEQEQLMARKYRVRPNDNLSKIAKKFYGDAARFRLIAKANNIREPFRIFPGQVLTIPDLPAPAKPEPEPAPPPPATPPEPIEFRILRPTDLVDLRCRAVGFRLIEGPPTGPVTYRVVRGDTLWGIADRFYDDPRRWRDIFDANRDRIRNPNRIFPGQVFVIPGVIAGQPRPPTPPRPTSSTYRVVRGDTLWDIADRFYHDPRRWREIFKANRDHISNPNLIFRGQVLIIPGIPGPAGSPVGTVTYTVVGGDTLSAIARLFYHDPRRWPEIFKANRDHIRNPNRIFPGQVLVIPGVATGTDPDQESDASHLVAASVDAFIVVHFGSQNLFEQTIEETDSPPATATQVLAARDSRVVFRAPLGTSIEFSASGVLRALTTLPLVVSASAKRASAKGSDLDEAPAPPTAEQTSIEAPFRLVVSPGDLGAFDHDAEPTTAKGDPGAVELWSTRLTVRETSDGVDHDELAKELAVRALHARKDAGVNPDPFPGSLTASDRDLIVMKTSQPGADNERGPLAVKKLYLSALGGWIDWIGRWEGSGLSLYRHLAPMGRDAYVRVQEPGFLFPFGHRADLVKVTERQIEPAGNGTDPIARLRKRKFILLREREREYTVRDLPFTKVTIGPEVTGHLVVDESKPSVPCAPISGPPPFEPPPFEWSIVAKDHAGNDIKLTTPLVFVPDSAIDTDHIRATQETNDEWAKVATIPDRFEGQQVKVGRISPGGQEIAMAPPKAGDTTTTVRVERLWLNGTIDSANKNKTSTPRLVTAEVSIPTLSGLNGGAHPVTVRYPGSYRDSGFTGGPELFLELVHPADAENPTPVHRDYDQKLTFGGSSEHSGGFIQPNMGVQALSRVQGPIGSRDPATFKPSQPDGGIDPAAFFSGEAIPKLFGLFKLTDILLKTGLDKAPKLITENLTLVQSLPAELGRLLEALRQTSNNVAKLAADATKADNAAAAQPLQALKARADAARAALEHAGEALGQTLDDVLAGRPDDAAAQAHTFAGQLDQLDALVTAPALPAYLRAAVDKPHKALRGIAAVAGDEEGLASVVHAAATGTLRFDWHPDIGPWPDENHAVFSPRSKDGLTISVEVRAPGGPPPGQQSDQQSAHQPGVDVSAQLAAFDLVLPPGDDKMMQLEFSRIGFRVAPTRKPEIDVVFDKLVFCGVLGFIEKLRQVIPFDGFADPPHVDISPAAATAGFSLTLPSVAIGVFSLENISLSADCRIPFLGDSVTVGFGFCRKDSPFRLTVMAIGGGGWVGIRLSPKGLVVLEMGLEAGASLSLDFGVASGSVSVMVGVYLRLEGDKGQLTGYFRIRGEVDVLGLASASITLELSLRYDFDTGKLVGRASVRLEIEVLFFSTSVEVSVERRLAGSRGDPKLLEIMPPDRGGQQMWNSYFDAFALGV